jgi:integrase
VLRKGGRRRRYRGRRHGIKATAARCGKDVTPGNLLDPTFAEWVPRFMATKTHLRPSSREVLEVVLQTHVLPYFGPGPLKSVEPTDVQAFISHPQARRLSASTIRHAYTLVSGTFAPAVDSGRIARTACRGVSLPRQERKEMRFLSPIQIQSLAENIEPRYKTLVLTSAYTGLRFGELAALELRHLDMLRGSLRVDQSLSEVKGLLTVSAVKTTASRRTVALPKFLVDDLASHLSAYPSERFVFSSSQGDPLRRSNFRGRYWLPAVRGSVGEPLRFHDLRHSHAAILIAQGERSKVIQGRLGHSDIRTTLNTYGHLFEGLDEAAADRLNDLHTRAPADYPRTAAT